MPPFLSQRGVLSVAPKEITHGMNMHKKQEIFLVISQVAAEVSKTEQHLF
jgi:hypothetical protein